MNTTTYQSNGDCRRRDFLKLSAIGGLGLAMGNLALAGSAAASAPGTPFGLPKVPPIDPVRIGFVGVGGMGTNHVGNMLRIEGVEIRAVCDIVESKAARVQAMVVKAGQRKPEAYTRGETDFQRLCQQEDLDLVFTATPWEWHVPVCLAAMINGKHAATEVPAAVTLGTVLAVGGNGGEDRPALRHDGELLLRPDGTDDLEHGPERSLGRVDSRGMRLPARSARAQAQRRRRRAVAARACR